MYYCNLNQKTIKKILKNIKAFVFITTVLLPFAVQFSHAINHFGHHHACENSNELHIDYHHFDCEGLHFQINHNTIVFENNYELVNHSIPSKIVFAYFNIDKQTVNLHKSSRAPPILML